MRVTVNITRRPEIADPQGKTTTRALHDLGYTEVLGARVDRTIHLEVEGTDTEAAMARIREMCEQLLANPVLEDFEIVIG